MNIYRDDPAMPGIMAQMQPQPMPMAVWAVDSWLGNRQKRILLRAYGVNADKVPSLTPVNFQIPLCDPVNGGPIFTTPEYPTDNTLRNYRTLRRSISLGVIMLGCN